MLMLFNASPSFAQKGSLYSISGKIVDYKSGDFAPPASSL